MTKSIRKTRKYSKTSSRLVKIMADEKIEIEFQAWTKKKDSFCFQRTEKKTGKNKRKSSGKTKIVMIKLSAAPFDSLYKFFKY